MDSTVDREHHRRFLQAFQREHLTCGMGGCQGPLEVTDMTMPQAKVKTYEAVCTRCHRSETIMGNEQTSPPWDIGSVTMMAEAHLLHDQPACPFDDTPITFTSLPNPRRKARYRLSCAYCGRTTEMDWPPPEAKM
ncbi:hypothetical protein YTPLAS18_30380 [Nitrospira sp.]|nr:hypothetical protein YTPLAS18_30380 [Nitrospira sp.]